MSKIGLMNTDEEAKVANREKPGKPVPYTLRVQPDFKDRIQRGAFVTRKTISDIADEALTLWEQKYKEELKAGR